MTCGGENGTNECYLAVFSEHIAFAHHFVAPCPPVGTLVVLATPVKLSKMVGNSDSYPVQYRHSELSTLNSYRFVEKHLQADLFILKMY